MDEGRKERTNETDEMRCTGDSERVGQDQQGKVAVNGAQRLLDGQTDGSWRERRSGGRRRMRRTDGS